MKPPEAGAEPFKASSHGVAGKKSPPGLTPYIDTAVPLRNEDDALDSKIESLTTFIKAWIKSQSGPHMTIWHNDLALRVSFRGWKKIILERDFKRAAARTRPES